MSRELQLHQTTCPHCNARLTTATSVNGEDKPRAGAMSLCSYCGEWCAFDENLDLVKPTQAQVDYIAVCPVARTMRRTFDTLAAQEERPPALVMQKEVFERGLEQVPPRPPLAIHRTLH